MPLTVEYKPDVCYDIVASIAAAASESQVIDLAGCKLVGIITPASLGASAISILAATRPDGTYIAVNDGLGAPFSVPCSPSAADWADLTDRFLASARFIKIKTNSTLVSAAQITLATMAVSSPKA